MITKAVVLLALVTAFFLGALEAQVVNPLISSKLCDINNKIDEGVFCAVYTGEAGYGAGLYGSVVGKNPSKQGGWTRGVVGKNNTNSGIGVYGSAELPGPANGVNYGVYGRANGLIGFGVFGDASHLGMPGGDIYRRGRGIGVHGISAGDRGTGVRGIATNGSSQSSTIGVMGSSASPSGKGVYGVAGNESGANYGVYGKSNSTEGRGVVGFATAVSGKTYGVLGANKSSQGGGGGVYGLAENKTSTDFTFGVVGRADSSTKGAGVAGYAPADRGKTYGVFGQSNSRSGVGVHGFAKSTGGRTAGLSGESESALGFGVYGFNKATGGGMAIGVLGKTASPGGYGVYSEGSMFVEGNLLVSGSKTAVASLNNGQGVRFYAEEASENWFADYGMAQLENGRALVNIDPTFGQTVNTKTEYHVFLTPRGDCNGLYVTNQGEASFEVVELQGGRSNISFSYRIMAKRIGYETQRLVRISKEEMQAPLLEKDVSEKSNTADQIVLSGMPQISDPN